MSALVFKSDIPLLSLVVFDKEASQVLGIVTESAKSKHTVITETSKRIELAGNRLKVIAHKLAVTSSTSPKEIAAVLTAFRAECLEAVGDDAIREIWDFSSEEGTELTEEEMSVTYYGDRSPIHILGLRLRILENGLYFRREKRGFVARTPQSIEEVKANRAISEAAQLRRKAVTSAFRQSIEGITDPSYIRGVTKLLSEDSRLQLKNELQLLTSYAAWGEQWEGPKAKEAKQLLGEVKSALGHYWDKIKLIDGTQQNDDAFAILLALGEFRHHQNLSLIRHQPPQEWSDEALVETQAIAELPSTHSFNDHSSDHTLGEHRLDLTGLASFTIDDASTGDMDDAFSLVQTEQGFQLGIHISDVAAKVPMDRPESPCALDHEALIRASSIYCPDATINMLPATLAEGTCSLRPQERSLCVSLIIELDHQLKVVSYEFRRTVIKSMMKYSYDGVDTLLDEDHPPFDLLLLSQIAASREAERVSRETTFFHRKEIVIEVPASSDTPPVLRFIDMSSPARNMVAEMMVLYNNYAARYAFEKGAPFPYRVQPAPDEQSDLIDAIPEGPAREYALRGLMKRSEIVSTPKNEKALYHASLALPFYTQVTSPIRRYLDLCGQRQLTALIENRPLPYSSESIDSLNLSLGDSLGKVQLVSRETKRYWILEYLRFMMKEKENLFGTVIRNDHRGTLVEVEDLGFNHGIRPPTPPPPLGSRILLEITSVHPRNDVLRLKMLKR
jgi:exoribonuclease-2